MSRSSQQRGLANRARVLLVNPPIYDIRLHWPKWQVPLQLLAIGAEYKRNGSDVRLLDCHRFGEHSKKRRQVEPTIADDTVIKTWRFGLPEIYIRQHLEGLKSLGWNPDLLIIEGFTTFWFKGVREVAGLCQTIWPKCKLAAVGAYAELTFSHALKYSSCDEVLPPVQVDSLLPDYSLYEGCPPTTMPFRLPSEKAEVKAFVEALDFWKGSGVREFSFWSRDLKTDSSAIKWVAEECRTSRQQFPFDILGCLPPAAFIGQADLIRELRAIGLKHTCLSDDREIPSDRFHQFAAECEGAADAFHDAGFKPRTDALTAGLCIGKHPEDLGERGKAATVLNHSVGSVIIWPYQPAVTEVGHEDDLHLNNGKLFPLRRKNGYTYRDYAELVALNAVLNSRYRDCSFDFLGEGLIARLLASSIKREGWNPSESVKGPIALPMRLGT